MDLLAFSVGKLETIKSQEQRNRNKSYKLQIQKCNAVTRNVAVIETLSVTSSDIKRYSPKLSTWPKPQNWLCIYICCTGPIRLGGKNERERQKVQERKRDQEREIWTAKCRFNAGDDLCRSLHVLSNRLTTIASHCRLPCHAMPSRHTVVAISKNLHTTDTPYLCIRLWAPNAYVAKMAGPKIKIGLHFTDCSFII